MTDLMEPVAGFGPAEYGPALDAWLKLGVQIESNTAELRRQREEREQLWQEISYVPIDPLQVAFASLPAVFHTACKTGFTWAVQAVSVAGFASATDTLTIYRGAAPYDAVPQNQRQVMSESLYTWHPGRTGFLLKPSQTLVVGGGTSGSTYTVNFDVIQVSDAKLPFFLL